MMMTTMRRLSIKPLQTIPEAAQSLQISPLDLQDLIASGDLPTVGTRRKLIRSADILKFVNPHEISLQETKKAPDKQMLLTDVMDEMLATKEGAVEGATMDDYIYGAKHIRRGFDGILIADIRPKDVELFYQALSNPKTGQRYSDHTIQTVRKVLNMTFKYAYLNKHIAEPFPIRDIKVPKGIMTEKDNKFLSAEQIAQTLALLQDHPFYYTLTKLLAATGMRIGEALAVQYTDFDRESGVLYIRRAIKRGKRKENCLFVRENKVDLPKSYCSKRKIPVPPEVFNMIENWRNFIRRDKHHYALCLEKGTHQYLFVNKRGQLHTYSSLSHNYKKYLDARKPSTSATVTFHMLRHSYGSLLVERGVELKVVSERLGHSSIKITADIYITVTQRLSELTMSTAKDVLTEISALEKQLI